MGHASNLKRDVLMMNLRKNCRLGNECLWKALQIVVMKNYITVC